MLSPKENYLKVLRGEIPEFLPSYFEPAAEVLPPDGMGVPVFAPDGPVYSPWGVKYVGSADINNGAIPEPGNFLVKDILKWRDTVKNPDLSNFDFEKLYTKSLEGTDRQNKIISCAGGDYFQTIVSFMGFETTLMAMYEEPEEIMALFEYVSEHNLLVTKNQLKYLKPDVYCIADDCAAANAPFFSPEMYRTMIKPFQMKHAELIQNSGAFIARHDCGRSEAFIEDWMDLGVRTWNPAQTVNDLKAIKKKYAGRLTLEGCWDNQGRISMPETPDDELLEALHEYVDTFAPGGGFVFSARIPGDVEDERVKRKTKLVETFFYDYARDYYKNH